MVEALFNAAIVVLIGFLIYFQREKYGRISLGIAYFLVFYFAVCRPWFLIFIFIPAFYHFKLKKIESVVASIVTEDAKSLQRAFDVMEAENPWENTVLYVYPNVNTNYCYYLPEGVGVNLCIEYYINEVYTTTPAKYILTNYNDGIYGMYTEWGWNVIAQGQQFVLYAKP